jgi:hypothetical protein
VEPYELDAGHELGDGQVDFSGEIVKMADEAREDLSHALVGVPARCGYDRVGDGGVVDRLLAESLAFRMVTSVCSIRSIRYVRESHGDI